MTIIYSIKSNPVDSDNRGFTLTELLVAIAIIAILAALLSVSVKSIRERGNESVCVGNLRQIGVANKLYLQDNSQTFPNGVSDKWFNDLAPYLYDSQNPLLAKQLKCPSQTASDIWYDFLGYSYNMDLSLYVKNAAPLYGKESSKILCWDGSFVHNGIWWGGWAGIPQYTPKRHNGGFNAVMLDGHVEKFKHNDMNTKNWRVYPYDYPDF